MKGEATTMDYFKKTNVLYVTEQDLNARVVAFSRGERHKGMKMARRYARRKLKEDLRKEIV